MTKSQAIEAFQRLSATSQATFRQLASTATPEKTVEDGKMLKGLRKAGLVEFNTKTRVATFTADGKAVAKYMPAAA